ncbi:MAG: glycosylase [Erysipelotrichaceae bacterium]|nr:glycosylase [Erysipelotrichaceae bacterium]
MNRKIFRDMIAYEIYPTSFYDSNNDGTGDLAGVTAKLDYIANMGFNAIWLNPFYRSPFRDGGYDVSDFFDVDPRFGTLQDFDELIAEAHKRKIRIILDLIAGHASSEKPDFIQSAEPERNEKSDLFIWNDNVWNLEPGYRLISGMHQRNGCYLVNFFAHQPAFNYGFNRISNRSWQMSYKDKRTLQAREYILNILRFWLARGADGFRVDMADSLVKNDDDKKATIEVWKWLFSRIRREYPQAFFVSEWSNPQQALQAGFDADFVLDHWDNFYHRFFRSNSQTRGKAVINGADAEFALKDMRWRFEKAEEYKAYLALISGNHDTHRIANYLDERQLRIFYMMLFMLPGIPFVLYGDEIAMKTSDLSSKDGGFQRTGTRTPMNWDNSLRNHGFSNTDSELYLPVNEDNPYDVRGSLEDPDSLYNFIRNLIRLRHEISDLRKSEMQISDENGLLRFERGKYDLLVNLSRKKYRPEGKIVFASEDDKETVRAMSAALIRKG